MSRGIYERNFYLLVTYLALKDSSFLWPLFYYSSIWSVLPSYTSHRPTRYRYFSFICLLFFVYLFSHLYITKFTCLFFYFHLSFFFVETFGNFVTYVVDKPSCRTLSVILSVVDGGTKHDDVNMSQKLFKRICLYYHALNSGNSMLIVGRK